ncbi:MAG: hypothetical protein HY074_00925 [Deltaproteobacteria bacterium]|nr:hypothetical protein [Deltaproteobacteria bacterium]
MSTLPSVNRSLIIIRAREPMVKWLHGLPDRSETEKRSPITLEELNTDNAAYLTPEFESDEELAEYLDAAWKPLFEEILEGWSTHEPWWPKGRSRKMFDAWFEVTMHSVVYDTNFNDELEHLD